MLTAGLFLFANYTVNSQTIVKEVSFNLFGKDEKNAKFTLKTFSVSNDIVTAGAFIQRKATVDNKKTFKILKEGYFPAVKIFKTDKNLENKSIDVKNINLNSYTDADADYILRADKINEIGNSKSDLSYEDIQKQYPGILMPKDTKLSNIEYFIENERSVKKKIYDTKFDVISNSVFKTETGIKALNLEYPQTTLIRKKYGYGLSNDKNDIYIFLSGLYYDKKARKADPSKKWNEYRQYEFNSFDKNGKCLSSYNINFDYPKIIKYNTKVFTNGKFEGFIYIFGYMPGAKKYNNKETANTYWAVYFDENGKHVFTKEFDSKNGTFFYTVHKFNDKLFLFVQGNEMKYGVIKLSPSDYEQIAVENLADNTINGDFQNGIEKSYSPIYSNNKVFVSENGDFLVVLEKKTTKSVKKGDKVVKINTFRSFALHFDKEGNFTKQYILPVKNNKSKSYSKKYSMITSTSDKFVLLSEEAIAKYKAKPYSVFYTLDAKKTVEKNVMKHLLSPVVTVINISSAKISSSSVSKEPFYMLSKDVLYKLDKNNIYFVGTNKDRNNLVFTKMKY